MGLEATHPDYDTSKDDWIQQRDLYVGERAVKAKRDVYLPPTPSMYLDSYGKKTATRSIGDKNYDAYLLRALFPDFVREAVEILVGMLHFKPAEIKVPKKMEPLLTSATLTGESMLDVLRRINTEQLITGRIGILADLPEAPAVTATNQASNTAEGKTADLVLPYLATYVAESIINWDEATDNDGFSALNLVVMNESGVKRQDDFTWKNFKKYRILVLGDATVNEKEQAGVYSMGVFTDTGGTLNFDPEQLKPPVFMGKTLEEIPFVFINTKDLLSIPDLAPLLGLGRLVLAIYRGDADYRQALFLTGQDTLVIIGGVRTTDGAEEDPEAVRTGAGSRIDVDINGDAKYIGVDSAGIPELRTSLENDKKAAATKSGQLLPTGKANSQESGEALKTRLAAQTASLVQVAQTGAKGLENILKAIARWMDEDETQVEVKPNMEFGDLELSATDITGLMGARLQGAPISKKSIHTLMVEKRLTTMTFEEEMEQIMEEDAEMPRVAAGAGNITAEEQLAQEEQRRQDEKDAADAKSKADAAKNKNKPV